MEKEKKERGIERYSSCDRCFDRSRNFETVIEGICLRYFNPVLLRIDIGENYITVSLGSIILTLYAVSIHPPRGEINL